MCTKPCRHREKAWGPSFLQVLTVWWDGQTLGYRWKEVDGESVVGTQRRGCRRGHLQEGLTEEVLFGLNLAVQIRAAREDAIKWHIIT